MSSTINLSFSGISQNPVLSLLMNNDFSANSEIAEPSQASETPDNNASSDA